MIIGQPYLPRNYNVIEYYNISVCNVEYYNNDYYSVLMLSYPRIIIMFIIIISSKIDHTHK